ncbi:MAG: HAMP domain-containing protein [Planctomycetes bacterium]|nr:HAMP domain-containing protein [Planctomycetota bacterium]
MKLGGLSWKLLGWIAVVVVVALGTFFWLFTAEVERLRDEELSGQLLAEARLLGYALQDSWSDRDTQPIAGMVDALHREGTDVVVMVTDGTALVNTTESAAIAEELLQQSEVRTALIDGAGESTREDIHGAVQSRVVAVRVGRDVDELGVVWLARPRWTFVTTARSFGRVMFLMGLIALATILVLGLTLTRRWARLLRRLTYAAQGLAQGDLSVKADVGGADEFALLAHSLNRAGRRLLAHAETIDRQRLTLEALLDQLQEGVAAADADGRILLINPAALRLLNVGPPADGHAGLLGKMVEACVPSYDLQRMLHVRPQSAGSAEQAIEERHLRIETPAGVTHVLARAADLNLPGESPGGRLAVLTDITALRRALESQTAFVANASHELRTPLSSIRAAVETLAQLDLSKDHAEAGQFIDMIDRHSARLAAMAADLLDLSRLQSSATPVEMAPLPLANILNELRDRFQDAARTKNLNWRVDWPRQERETIVANTRLLRLMLDNLVANAIQFTDPGGHVTFSCRSAPGEVAFEVVDDGCGIPEAEQERIFERFYQVERARSGPRRGTGLGLSIVKDAVAAMRGSIQLESKVGVGTRFSVRFPQPSASSPEDIDGLAQS